MGWLVKGGCYFVFVLLEVLSGMLVVCLYLDDVIEVDGGLCFVLGLYCDGVLDDEGICCWCVDVGELVVDVCVGDVLLLWLFVLYVLSKVRSSWGLCCVLYLLFGLLEFFYGL